MAAPFNYEIAYYSIYFHSITEINYLLLVTSMINRYYASQLHFDPTFKQSCPN